MKIYSNQSKLVKYIAKTISFITHPLLIPTYGLLFFFNSNTYFSVYFPEQLQKIIYAIVFVTTFLIPVTSLPILFRLKIIQDISMPTKKERITPMILTLCTHLMACYLLYQLPFRVPVPIMQFMIGSSAIILFGLMLTTVWKISAHMLGMGGILALVFMLATHLNANVLSLFLAIILISGITAFSRLFLSAHNPAQTYIGFVIGFIGITVSFLISV